jgi:hypothetical protein
MPDFKALARDIQNRASRRVGTATTKAQHFREFFGTSVLVIKKTWELLERDSLLPEGGRSALGPSLYEGVPQAEHLVFGRRRVNQGRRPEDPPQVGVGVH